MSSIKIVELKETSTELSPYCHFARPENYISVTEWSNGEGKDIRISCVEGEKRISLTHGEFQALEVLWNYKY